MELNYDGKELHLDLEDMDTVQTSVMERHGVANLAALENGVAVGDVKTLEFVYWLARIQSGETLRIEKLGPFKPIKFLRAIAKAQEEEAAAAEAEAPKEAEGEA